MAKSISFDSGLVEYEINGVQVSFNPTDETFVHKLEGAFHALDNIQGELDGSAGFEQFIQMDRDMRGIIDGLLGDGISDKLFPNMNCYALADGLPVWMNLMLALWDEVAEVYEREFGKTDNRMKAHNAKYDAMMSKYRKGKR